MITDVYKNDKKYAGWLWTLRLLGVRFFLWGENTTPCPKSWKHFFDSGISPMDALHIDFKEQ